MKGVTINPLGESYGARQYDGPTGYLLASMQTTYHDPPDPDEKYGHTEKHYQFSTEGRIYDKDVMDVEYKDVMDVEYSGHINRHSHDQGTIEIPIYNVESWDELENGDMLMLLYVTYSDGSTFDTIKGKVAIIGAFHDFEEGKRIKKLIQDNERGRAQFDENLGDIEEEFGGQFLSWHCYFGGFTRITARLIDVKRLSVGLDE